MRQDVCSVDPCQWPNSSRICLGCLKSTVMLCRGPVAAHYGAIMIREQSRLGDAGKITATDSQNGSKRCRIRSRVSFRTQLTIRKHLRRSEARVHPVTLHCRRSAPTIRCAESEALRASVLITITCSIAVGRGRSRAHHRSGLFHDKLTIKKMH